MLLSMKKKDKVETDIRQDETKTDKRGIQVAPMTEAEQEFRISQADKTVQSLTNRKSKTNLFSFLFLLLTVVIIAIIAVVEFTGEDEYPLSAVLQTWGQNWKYLAMALILMLTALFIDGFRQGALLRGATGKWRIKLTLKSMILGRYFDNITPSAAGGQPYQVYYLHKNKVPAGVATSLPIVCFFMQQLAFFFIVVLCFIIRGPIVNDLWLQIAIYVGSVFMIFIPVTIMVFAFIPKTAKKLLGGLIKLLHKIKIVKDIEGATLKFNNYLDDYSRSLKLIGKHKKTLISGFILAFGVQMLQYSVTYFIVLASGAPSDYWTVIACMAYTSAAGALIPTPGSSGVSEGLFYMIFSMLSGGFRFWGMLLWRIITYYLPTLIGMGVLINNTVKEKSYKKRGLLRTSAEDDDDSLRAKDKATQDTQQ